MLTGFTGRTGAKQDGDIDFSWTYPKNVDGYGQLKLLVQPGKEAPADCDSGATIKVFEKPFKAAEIAEYTHETGSAIGETYSYRLCVYLKDGSLLSSLSVADLQARDSTKPGALKSFTAISGPEQGQIKLILDLPDIVVDYKRLDIRRLEGAAAPGDKCDNGSVVFSLDANFVDQNFIDTPGGTSDKRYGYRVCIYDVAGNLTSGNSQAGVQVLDTIGPKALADFTAATGTVQSQVQLNWTIAGDGSDIKHMEIHFLKGATPSCSTGTVIPVPVPAGGVLFHTTPSSTGEEFTYRACLYDARENVTASEPRSARAFDTQAPPSVALLARTGSNPNEVSLTAVFPSNVSDIDHVVVRRKAGAQAPDSCSSDTSVSTPQVQAGQQVFTDIIPNVTSTTKTYSYLICSYDHGNIENRGGIATADAKDGGAPVTLPSLSVQPGSGEGDINVQFTVPSDANQLSDYDHIDFHIAKGADAPNCEQTPQKRINSADFGVNGFNYATGDRVGSTYTVRACVFDSAENSVSKTASGATKDSQPPQPLKAFVVTADSSQLALTLTLPTNHDDYNRLLVSRASGAAAPSSCADNVVLNKTRSQLTSSTVAFSDGPFNKGDIVSYLVCIRDNAGNETRSDKRENIKIALCDAGGVLVAGHCWFKGTGESCSSICGGYNNVDSATTNYVGSGGSAAACLNVVHKLQIGLTLDDHIDDWPGNDKGCFVVAHLAYHGTAATNYKSSGSDYTRVCACK